MILRFIEKMSIFKIYEKKRVFKTIETIKKEIRDIGVTVKFYTRKVSYNWGAPNFGVSGCYYAIEKKISIINRGKNSYALKLAVLAHELRHAIHDKERLFYEYYDPKFQDKEYQKKIILGEETTIPNLKICLEAENDCNRFARDFLQSNGIILDPNKKSHNMFFTYSKYSIAYYYYKDQLYKLAKKENLSTFFLDSLFKDPNSLHYVGNLKDLN
jgi:Zn-dependent peptidase ImmA (M78 family)